MTPEELAAITTRAREAATEPIELVVDPDVSLWRENALIPLTCGDQVVDYETPEEYEEGDLLLEVTETSGLDLKAVADLLDSLLQARRDRAALLKALPTLPEPMDDEAEGDDRTWDAGLLTTGTEGGRVALALGGLAELPGFSPERITHENGGDDLMMSPEEAEAMAAGLLAAAHTARRR